MLDTNFQVYKQIIVQNNYEVFNQESEIIVKFINKISKLLPGMPENIKVYKFLFRANITAFDLKANISSPLIVNWKRSSQTATTEPVQMVGGKASINQILTLPVNMYFEEEHQRFQEKKSVFSFTMKAPKGDKQAGVVYVNLAAQVNDKLQVLIGTYSLQKCPVKNSQVHIQITAQCIGQKQHDTMSQSSFIMQQGNPSALSVQSHYMQQKRPKVKQVTNISAQVNKQNLSTPSKGQVSPAQLQQKDKRIRQLQQSISQLKRQNTKVKSDLDGEKELNKKLTRKGQEGNLINSLKEQLIKGKSIQSKLQSEIDQYRHQNVQHQKELEAIRQKMDRIYDNLCRQFDIQQL